MITIIGRRLFIPDCDRVLGTTDEANTKIKIKLSDETVEKFFPEGITSSAVNVTLVMETEEGDAFPSVAFVWAKDGVHEGYVNLVDRNYTGLVKARALLTYRGNDSVTVSMQTEEDYFYVTDDINGSGINEGDSEYKAWDSLLTDIKSETSKVTNAVGRFESYFTESEGEISKAEYHYANFGNPHKVTAEQVGTYGKDEIDNKVAIVSLIAESTDVALSVHKEDYKNPHKVTAEQVGAYTKSAVDGKVGSVGVIADTAYQMIDMHQRDYSNPHKVTAEQVGAYDKNETYSKGEVFNKGEIRLMFEEHGGGGAGVEVDGILDGNSNNPVANKVLYAKFASIDGKIGDIDAALDAILEIQESLMPSEGTLG